jgi:hypothetical protein
MGTSVNQGSAKSSNWDVAQAGYRSNVPVDRVVQEIWRAATNQKQGDIANLLAQPIVARVAQIAVQASSPLEAATAVRTEIARSKEASLAADIAHRAAVQCVTHENRAQAYGEHLFAEACNYLLSRDLPGFVGTAYRNHTVGDTLAFKASVLESTMRAVQERGHPDFSTDERWRTYVEGVVSRLKKRAT